MDSNPLEREREFTILAKNTSVRWRHENQYRGHLTPISAAKSSAFCAWSMFLLLVDAARCRCPDAVRRGEALSLG